MKGPRVLKLPFGEDFSVSVHSRACWVCLLVAVSGNKPEEGPRGIHEGDATKDLQDGGLRTGSAVEGLRKYRFSLDRCCKKARTVP